MKIGQSLKGFNIYMAVMRALRNMIKGWSCNIDAEMRKTKTSVLTQLDDLDRLAEKNKAEL
jgi:hypothetical protein